METSPEDNALAVFAGRTRAIAHREDALRSTDARIPGGTVDLRTMTSSTHRYRRNLKKDRLRLNIFPHVSPPRRRN